MQKQLGYLGHVLSSGRLVKDCMLGLIEGTRARGKQRMSFMDGVKAVFGCEGIAEVVRMAERIQGYKDTTLLHVQEMLQKYSYIILRRLILFVMTFS